MSENDDFLQDELDDSVSDWAPGLDDDFDRLREDTARSSDVFSEMEVSDEGGGGFLSAFSPAQRNILLILVLFAFITYAILILTLVLG